MFYKVVFRWSLFILQIIFNTREYLALKLQLRNGLMLLLLFLRQMAVKFNKMVYSAFCVLLIVHLGITLVNNQLDPQLFFMYVYF